MEIMYYRACFALFLVLVLAGLVTAQERGCTAKLADLPQTPELYGFHLGMNLEQVKARVPQVAFGRTDDLGVSKTSISPSYDSRFDNSTFANVRTVSLDFLDGRVVAFWIGYEESFKWKSVPEFVSEISRAFGIPKEWTTKGRGQQLRCAD